DGSVIRTRPAARSTTGLDLKRLFIGSEGTLGIVTGDTLRVFPVPKAEEIHAFRLKDFATGFAALGRLYGDGLTPRVMDLAETFEAPDLLWSGEACLPPLSLGFSGT